MLDVNTLMPAAGARLGEVRFQEWLKQPAMAR
jgi:hypothetical protein